MIVSALPMVSKPAKYYGRPKKGCHCLKQLVSTINELQVEEHQFVFSFYTGDKKDFMVMVAVTSLATLM